MAKKKRSIAAATVALSSSRRRPPESDPSAEGSVQALKNLNIRLTAERAELQKAVKRLNTKIALAGSSSCIVDGSKQGGVTMGTLKTAEQEAAVEMAAEQEQGKRIVSEQKQSKTCCSEPVSVSKDCNVDIIEPKSFVEKTEQEQCKPVNSDQAANSGDHCIAACAADIPVVEADLATGMNYTRVKMQEGREEVGIEKIIGEKNAEYTEAVGIEKWMEESLQTQLLSISCVEDNNRKLEEEMKVLAHEITSLKKRLEVEMELSVNMATEKKNKWIIFKWIILAGFFVAVALYTESK